MIAPFLLALFLAANAQTCNPYVYSNPSAGSFASDLSAPRLGLKFSASVDGCLQGVRFNLVGANTSNTSNVTVEVFNGSGALQSFAQGLGMSQAGFQVRICLAWACSLPTWGSSAGRRR
jgi:hypothetical protein